MKLTPIKNNITTSFVIFATSLVGISFAFSAYGQNKFFSTPSRDGASAKEQAITTTIINENQRANTCTAQGLIYAPTHASSGSDGCTIQAASRTLGGDLSVAGSAGVGGPLQVSASLNVSDSMVVENDVLVGGGISLLGGLKLGQSSICNSEREGTLSYDSSQKLVLVCDGSNWAELGGAAPAFQNVDIVSAYQVRPGTNTLNISAYPNATHYSATFWNGGGGPGGTPYLEIRNSAGTVLETRSGTDLPWPGGYTIGPFTLPGGAHTAYLFGTGSSGGTVYGGVEIKLQM